MAAGSYPAIVYHMHFTCGTQSAGSVSADASSALSLHAALGPTPLPTTLDVVVVDDAVHSPARARVLCAPV